MNKAIELKPDYAEAHSSLGTTLHYLGMLDEAELSLREAIALKSDLAAAQSSLGSVLLKKGQHREGLNEILIADGIISFNLKGGMSI